MCLSCPEIALGGFRHVQLEGTAEIKRLKRARRIAISHAYSQALRTENPFRSSALLSGVYGILLITNAERGGLSRFVRGPTTSKDRALPRLPTSGEDLSGPQYSPQAFVVTSLTGVLSAEGCHALCENPPPLTRMEGSCAGICSFARPPCYCTIAWAFTATQSGAKQF